MNDEAKDRQESRIETEQDRPVGSSKSAAGLWLLTLLSVLAIGLSAAVYFQIQKLKADVFELPSTLKQIEAGLKGFELGLSRTREDNQQLKIELAAVQQQQADLSSSIGSISEQQDRGNDDWRLAEIEHLLIIATHRLQLEHDVSMALAAMQAADARLRTIDDFRLLPIRQQLMADMNALKAVADVDITGLALFLSDLVGRVTDLPLKKSKVIADIAQDTGTEVQNGKWEKLKSSIWQELKDLVLISRQGEEALATLVPEQQYFLYQNLRLQLESARYAVLRRDTENLHVSVDIIISWLGDYFDARDNGVANIHESLSRMTTLDLNPSLPDISSSLETLRAYVKRQDESTTIMQEPLPRGEQ